VLCATTAKGDKAAMERTSANIEWPFLPFGCPNSLLHGRDESRGISGKNA
jgi:hypothetical protein